MLSKSSLRIVFMGTPDFAVESLRSLVEDGYQVVGVVTMPDKPVGRHQTVLQASPVKRYAEEKGLPVLQPEKLKDPVFLEQLRALRADLQVVVAFRMLPEVVWAMPPMGTFNLHASLLPQYRGAAPINWAIINGETETGLTTFFLQHEIDTGNIIRQVRVPVAPTDNAGDLHDRLMQLGGALVTETVDLIARGDVQTVAQPSPADGIALKPAPKIFKETCRIAWCEGVKRAYDFIRGLSPYPAAWSGVVRDGESEPATSVKIFTARFEAARHGEQPGTLFSDGRTLRVACVDGWIWLDELQMAGKKRLPVRELLLGWRDVNNCSFR